MCGAVPRPRPARSNPRLSRRPGRDAAAAAAAAAAPAVGPRAWVLGECDPSSRPHPRPGSPRVGDPDGWSQWLRRHPQEKATVWMVGREEANPLSLSAFKDGWDLATSGAQNFPSGFRA